MFTCRLKSWRSFQTYFSTRQQKQMLQLTLDKKNKTYKLFCFKAVLNNRALREDVPWLLWRHICALVIFYVTIHMLDCIDSVCPKFGLV